MNNSVKIPINNLIKNDAIKIIANNENKIKWIYKNNVYVLFKNNKTFNKVCKRIKIVQKRFPKLVPDIICVNKKAKFIITKQYTPLPMIQKCFITIYITLLFIQYEFFIPDVLFANRNIMYDEKHPKIIDFDGTSDNEYLYKYLRQNNINKFLTYFILFYNTTVKHCIKTKRNIRLLLKKIIKNIK